MDKSILDRLPHYLHANRQSHAAGQQRAEKISLFVRNYLGISYINVVFRGLDSPGYNVGSATKFYFHFDESWGVVDFNRPNNSIRFELKITVSERGPFITSWGGEWCLPAEKDDSSSPFLLPTAARLYEHEDAKTRARVMADLISQKFDLQYLEVEILRGAKVDEESLPEDVIMSLDYSEPNVVNVLFDEQT